MPENPLYAPLPEKGVPDWTVSQLVSYNLLRARRARGWTQQELGEALGRYMGRAWSNASVSAAERAWQGGRPRKFDVDEINSFCAIFDVPFAYFLLPPEGDFVIFANSEPQAMLGHPPVEYLKRILGVDPPPDFLERAQTAVSEHASLDFIPPKWEWDAGRSGGPGATQAAEPQEEEPGEEAVAATLRPTAELQAFIRREVERNVLGPLQLLTEELAKSNLRDSYARRTGVAARIPSTPIGRQLKSARAVKGMSIDDVSAKGTISPQVVVSLEANDFAAAALAAAPVGYGGGFLKHEWAKACIRRVAYVVDLDPEPLIEQYKVEMTGLGEE